MCINIYFYQIENMLHIWFCSFLHFLFNLRVPFEISLGFPRYFYDVSTFHLHKPCCCTYIFMNLKMSAYPWLLSLVKFLNMAWVRQKLFMCSCTARFLCSPFLEVFRSVFTHMALLWRRKNIWLYWYCWWCACVPSTVFLRHFAPR